MKVGVYGGSFDPPHMGHLMVATWVLGCGQIDTLLIIPTFSHVFDKSHGAEFETRIQMCRMAFSHLNNVDVSSIEEDLEMPNRTLHTLEALAASRPEDEFRLVVGADVLEQTDRWHRWDEVIRIAPPLVIGRKGYPTPPGCPIEVPNVSSTEIRRRLSKGEGIDGLVPGSVIDFIADDGLYSRS